MFWFFFTPKCHTEVYIKKVLTRVNVHSKLQFLLKPTCTSFFKIPSDIIGITVGSKVELHCPKMLHMYHHLQRDKKQQLGVGMKELTDWLISRLHADVLGKNGRECVSRKPKAKRQKLCFTALSCPRPWQLIYLQRERERLISLRGPEGFITISQQTIIMSLKG